MNIIHVLVLGVVEGLTEFLPVSSTAHLIFASRLLHISPTQFTTFFEVFIQSGAILAVVILYFHYILKHKSLISNLLISFIPTAVVGLVLRKSIKTVFFESMPLILTAFFIVGIIFLILEVLVKKKRITLSHKITDISVKQAILIGLAQSFAVIPGVSRAGAVIVSMMFSGFKREDAALYSFLLAIPTISAASAFDLLKTDFSIISNSNNILSLSIGFVMSFITALLVIKWFIRFLQKNTLVSFGIYRIILTLLLWSFL